MIGGLLCAAGWHDFAPWFGKPYRWTRICFRWRCRWVEESTWQERPPEGSWHESRGGEGPHGRITMLVWRLARVPIWRYRGKVLAIRLDLHKMIGPDAPGCFHTHPAWAIRFIGRGGYVEEVADAFGTTFERWWHPGWIGVVAPRFCHRISRVLSGESWSLWLRGPIVADVHLVGPGWSPELRGPRPWRN